VDRLLLKTMASEIAEGQNFGTRRHASSHLR
jgi:hypothetical protein